MNTRNREDENPRNTLNAITGYVSLFSLAVGPFLNGIIGSFITIFSGWMAGLLWLAVALRNKSSRRSIVALKFFAGLVLYYASYYIATAVIR